MRQPEPAGHKIRYKNPRVLVLGSDTVHKKVRVALLSVGSNAVLTTGKLIAGLSMHSVSVLSEAFHSGTDLLAALIAFFSVRQSCKPPDERHHFGHGKFENVASIIEALLIVVAAGVIIWHAVEKLVHPTPVEALGLGAIVMGISAAVNLVVSRILMQTGRETDSPALIADAWHLRTDVYTSVAVLLGIGFIKLTGWTPIDPLLGIAVALFILKAAYDLITESMHSLLDVRLPASEEEAIREVLLSHSNEFIEYHALRTRKAGSQRFIDLHIVAPPHREIAQMYPVCASIEHEIKERLPNASVLIHVEPCTQPCEECTVPCEERAGSR